MIRLLRRQITITLHLKVVVVLQNEIAYFAVIDESDLLGLKLRFLYFNNNLVEGCYIMYNGRRAYALMASDDGAFENRIITDIRYNNIINYLPENIGIVSFPIDSMHLPGPKREF